MALLAYIANAALRRERVFRDRLHPLDCYNDEEIVRKYRLSRPLILELIDRLDEDLAPNTQRNKALPTSLQVFVTLRVLATGSFQETVGDVHGVSKPTTSRKMHVVCRSIATNFRDKIKFPETQVERLAAKTAFNDVANFPNILGAIDGSLIPIKAPKQEEHLYVSRKGGHAMNIQVVCNAKMLITSAVVRYPATNHDSYIWNNCSLRQRFENGEIQNGWLLGDSGCVHCNDFIYVNVNIYINKTLICVLVTDYETARVRTET